jgi:hypothetical protein
MARDKLSEEKFEIYLRHPVLMGPTLLQLEDGQEVLWLRMSHCICVELLFAFEDWFSFFSESRDAFFEIFRGSDNAETFPF